MSPLSDSLFPDHLLLNSTFRGLLKISSNDTCSCLWNLTEVLYDPWYSQTKLEPSEVKAKEALDNDPARDPQEPAIKTLHELVIPRTLFCLAITHSPHTAEPSESSAWKAASALLTPIWEHLTLPSLATFLNQNVVCQRILFFACKFK